MARKGKWIEGVDADEPISSVAKLALRERLEVVWHYAPLAALHPEEDVEHVHQLRVSCRRAMAVLSTFSSLLPEGKRSRMAKRLAKLRRAAGDARDDDVLILRLTAMLRDTSRKGVEPLLDQVHKHRKASQQPIVATYKRLKRKNFSRRCEKLVAKTRWREDRRQPNYQQAARKAIGHASKQFFAAASIDMANVEALHALRIAGKQLRYTMEVFASAFPPRFREEIYPLVQRVQETLGDVNDHATAKVKFECWLLETPDDESAAVLRAMIAEEQIALARKRDQFLSWWTQQRANELAAALAEFASSKAELIRAPSSVPSREDVA